MFQNKYKHLFNSYLIIEIQNLLNKLLLSFGITLVLILTIIKFFTLNKTLTLFTLISPTITVFCVNIFKLLKSLKTPKFFYYIKSLFPQLNNELLYAYELNKSQKNYIGISTQIIKYFTDQTTKKIEDLGCIKFLKKLILKNTLKVSSSLVCLLIIISFNYKILIENLTHPQYNFQIIPGNKKVMIGEDVTIKLIKTTKPQRIFEKDIPQIFLSTDFKKNWIKFSMSQLENDFIHTINSLNTLINYYIKVNNWKSNIYTIQPIEKTFISDFVLTYHYPLYTAIEPKTFYIPQIESLKGTKINLTATVNKKLKKLNLYYNLKKISPKFSKTKIEVSFYIEQEGEYYFVGEDSDGFYFESPHYPIKIIRDSPPSCEILSPADDIIASSKDNVEMVVETSDDFGIKEIIFHYKVNENEYKKTIRSFPKNITSKIINYELHLSKLALKPGSIIKYFFEVVDSDTILGPKSGFSKTYLIEIFSFEKQHEIIKQEVEDIRQEILSTLEKQIELKEKLENLITKHPDTTKIPQESKTHLIDSQTEIQKDLSTTTEKLQQTLKKLYSDPLTEARVADEYKNINENLKTISSSLMNKSIDELKQQKYQNSKNTQEIIISELEKTALLSEDIMQFQNMENLINKAEEFVSSTEDLNNSLETSNLNDPQKLKELQNLVDELNALQSQINNLLKNLPKELPEEFINQEAIKQLDLRQLSDLSNQLTAALNEKNLTKAIELAKQLLKQAKELLQTLKTGSNYVNSFAMNNISQQTRKLSDEMNELVRQQEKLYEDTLQNENIRRNNYDIKSQDLLSTLAKRQLTVINKTKELINFNFQFNLNLTNYLTLTIPPMEKVYNELETKKVEKSIELLNQILDYLSRENHLISKSSETINQLKKQKEDEFTAVFEKINKYQNSLNFIIKEETEILELLKNPPINNEELFSENEKSNIQKMALKQSDLQEKLKGIAKGLNELSQKTATIPSDIQSNLASASNEMGSASSNLKKFSTNNATKNQSDALEYLRKVQDGLNNALAQQNSMSMSAKQQSSPSIQIRQTQVDGGILGVRTGIVKFPQAEDFIPQKEFQEEIMNSQKEKYPDVYQKEIKKYYERLVK